MNRTSILRHNHVKVVNIKYIVVNIALVYDFFHYLFIFARDCLIIHIFMMHFHILRHKMTIIQSIGKKNVKGMVD